MTVTLHLTPEVEAGLLVQADASGKTLEDYVLNVVEEVALSGGGGLTVTEPMKRSEAVRKMIAFGEKHRLSFGEPITRADLHEGHRI